MMLAVFGFNHIQYEDYLAIQRHGMWDKVIPLGINLLAGQELTINFSQNYSRS